MCRLCYSPLDSFKQVNIPLTKLYLILYLIFCENCQTMIFDKSLHLSSSTHSGGGMTAGQITNHMTVDAMNVLFFCQRIHYVWAVPLKVCLGLMVNFDYS